MTFNVSHVQAALLYAGKPEVDFDRFEEQVAAWCNRQGEPDTFAVWPLGTSSETRCFVGNGVHIYLNIRPQPIDSENFALPLRSPMLRHKALDFQQAIAAHSAAIVISVGDGETPDADATPNATPTDASPQAGRPFAKVAALQMAMQVLVDLYPPLMVDFGPSQSLLSPAEVVAVADERLPVPILIHPFPFRIKRPDGEIRRGMAAIHAQHLIGAELELEGIPDHMHMADRIDTLTALIRLKMDDVISLSHGENLETDSGEAVWIRHEEGSIEDGPPRISVSFINPEESAVTQTTDARTSFKGRLSNLKPGPKPATHERSADAPDNAVIYSESSAELLERVQDTMAAAPRSEDRKRTGSTVVLLLLTIAGGYLFVAQTNLDIAGIMATLTDGLSGPAASEIAAERIPNTNGTQESGADAAIPAASRAY